MVFVKGCEITASGVSKTFIGVDFFSALTTRPSRITCGSPSVTGKVNAFLHEVAYRNVHFFPFLSSEEETLRAEPYRAEHVFSHSSVEGSGRHPGVLVHMKTCQVASEPFVPRGQET